MPNPPQAELPKPKSWDDFEDIVWDLYTFHRLLHEAFAQPRKDHPDKETERLNLR